jgi:hypothetical protein
MLFIIALAPALCAQTPAARDAAVVIESRQLRFSVRRAVEHLRLQILDQAGEVVYDSGHVAEAEIAWAMRDGNGGELKGGLYAWTLTVKESGEETARTKRGHFILDRASQSDRLWVTSEGADGIGAELHRNGAGAVAGIERRNETTDRAAAERGFYLHPEVFGKPAEKHVEWARDPQGMRRMKDAREPKQPQ